MDKERAKELEVYANRLLAENLRRDRLAKDEKKRAKLELLKEHEVASEAEKGGEMLAALRQLPLLNDISDQDVQDVLGGKLFFPISKQENISLKRAIPPSSCT